MSRELGAVGRDLHIIKQSTAPRANYRADEGSGSIDLRICPQLVVPHTRNRGGVPVKALRTKELSGEVLAGGCDPTEACINAVAVQEQSGGVWT